MLKNLSALNPDKGPLVDAVEMAVACLEEHERRAVQGPGDRPTVTTLCGSTRFPDAFALAMMHLTLKGHVVLTVGMCAHADTPVGSKFLAHDGDESTPEKQRLDELHFRKIEMSDGIYVVNPGDYVGSSTMREVKYALELGKTVEWMFPTKRVVQR
jgi:hypothetical protein